jgi:hypothetical protein
LRRIAADLYRGIRGHAATATFPPFKRPLGLEREVRANLVYRDFTRVGGGKMPDAKTMGRWGVALGPAVIAEIHQRIIQIAHAKDERITKVPYTPTNAVDTFWDLGFTDNTCIWLVQAIGFEYRIIDYFSDSQRNINYYLDVLQRRGYIYGRDWLPHDAEAKSLGTGKSVQEIMQAHGRRVYIVPKLSVEDGINAARTIFPNCWFDEEKCADGLHALRHYRYEVDEDLGTFSKKPLHDWASHGAGASVCTSLVVQVPAGTLLRVAAVGSSSCSGG